MNKAHLPKPTIYLADDDADDRDLLTQAFEQITDKHHMKVFPNGKTLLEWLSLKTDGDLPCLIVLDYNMPELDGKDTLKYLQKSARYRNIPKVIYTTSNSLIEKAEFLSLGASDYITKASTFRGILNSAKIMLTHCDDQIRLTA